jgi:hypothetical protein
LISTTRAEVGQSTDQNTNNNNISYRGLLCHPLGRFSLGSIYMLIP